MEIRLANPRGFCAGVDRAIEIVAQALEVFGAPVYVRHQVVHNRTVVADLTERGAVFVEELSAVPPDSVVIFSAHGVAPEVEAEAARRKLHALDATCPLVTKVHLEVARFNRDGRAVVLVGHARHPEVEGTLGRGRAAGCAMHLVETVEDVAALPLAPDTPIGCVTQTTLSIDDTRQITDALRARFADCATPAHSDICYATQNRQNAVRELARNCDRVLVVGSANSSNSNRLVEIARGEGVHAHLIDDPKDIDDAWLGVQTTLGITAGASAPEALVQQVLAHLRSRGADTVREMEGKPEQVSFRLPEIIRRDVYASDDQTAEPVTPK